MWHYYTTYLETGGLFHKPHMSELRRTLLTVPLWDFQSLLSMSPGTERGKLLNRWQWMFLQWLYTHLVTSEPETFSTTRSFTQKYLPTLYKLTFQSEGKAFPATCWLKFNILYSFPAFNVSKFWGIPWLFWSNVTFSSVIYQHPLKLISHQVTSLKKTNSFHHIWHQETVYNKPWSVLWKIKKGF